MIMGLAHYKPEKPLFRAINPGSTVTCQRNGDSLSPNAMWIEPLGGWELELIPALVFQEEHFCLLSFITWKLHFENHQACTGLLNLVYQYSPSMILALDQSSSHDASSYFPSSYCEASFW